MISTELWLSLTVSNKYTLAFTVLKIQKNLTEECGFSTISECRKAINELEKQETWQDIFQLYNYSIGNLKNSTPQKLKDWLQENFKTPERL